MYSTLVMSMHHILRLSACTHAFVCVAGNNNVGRGSNGKGSSGNAVIGGDGGNGGNNNGNNANGGSGNSGDFSGNGGIAAGNNGNGGNGGTAIGGEFSVLEAHLQLGSLSYTNQHHEACHILHGSCACKSLGRGV